MVQEVGPRGQGTAGYRIRRGNVLGLTAMAFQSSLTPFGAVRLIYDDGTEDDLYFDPSVSTTAGTEFVAATRPAKKDGWVISGAVGLRATGFPARAVTGYGQMFIYTDANASQIVACLGQGSLGLRDTVTVGQFPANGFDAVFAFHGTVLEDATAGTHLSTLTVTAGAGNAFQLMYGMFVAGAGAANLLDGFIDDGTNVIARFINPTLSLASGQTISFPFTGTGSASGTVHNVTSPITVSGTMRLIIRVSTATVSLTHTFSLALRIKNGPPSTVLADSVGTPTLTTNTSGVF